MTDVQYIVVRHSRTFHHCTTHIGLCIILLWRNWDHICWNILWENRTKYNLGCRIDFIDYAKPWKGIWVKCNRLCVLGTSLIVSNNFIGIGYKLKCNWIPCRPTTTDKQTSWNVYALGFVSIWDECIGDTSEKLYKTTPHSIISESIRTQRIIRC